MYIPNSDNIKVGYGYRLLDENEIVKMDHEVISNGICYGNKDWERIIWNPARKYSDFKKDFAHQGKIYVRCKIEIPEGYRLVGKNEVFKNEEDIKFKQFHYGHYKVGEWQMSRPTYGNTPNGMWSFKRDKIDLHGVAYIEKIQTNIKTMNTKDQNLELELEIARREQSEAQNRIEELEKKIKEKNEIKVGDYVVNNNTLYIYKVRKIIKDNVWMEGYDDSINVPISAHRRATKEEITKYLIEEANKEGWVIGAKVKNDIGTYCISRLSVYFGDKETSVSNVVQQEWETKKSPLVYIEYGGYLSPLSDLKLIKEEPIVIVVDGKEYIAQFSEFYADFGCARISRHQIETAYKFLCSQNEKLDAYSNRRFESVKIGKGEFNLELLTKIKNEFDKFKRLNYE